MGEIIAYRPAIGIGSILIGKFQYRPVSSNIHLYI